MNYFVIKVGDIVESVQGRDLGTRYLVIDIDKKGYLSLINGDIRPMNKPKTKNARHLSFVGHAEDILNRLDNLTNCELNKLIKKVNNDKE